MMEHWEDCHGTKMVFVWLQVAGKLFEKDENRENKMKFNRHNCVEQLKNGSAIYE